MRGRFFLARFIALLIAALGLLGPGLPAHASPSHASPSHVSPAAATPSAMAAMPAGCPMNDHARNPSDGPAGMAAGCACCCAVVAGPPDVPGAAPPSVVRLAMAPVPVLGGGPGRSIPPALGPPRPAGDNRSA